MATELTFKERTFAQLVVEGTKSEAYRRVYSAKGNSRTQATNAYKISKRPKVKQEVARLLRQRLTLLRSPHDAEAQAEHIAARLLELTKSPEPEVALRAIAQWGKLAEAGVFKPSAVELHTANRRQPSVDERRQIVNQLRALYQKALPKPQNFAEQLGQPITELPKPHDSDIDVEPADTASTVPPQAMVVVDASYEEPFAVNDSMKRPEPVEKFRLAPIPGYFPPRYRRVQRP